MPIGLALSGGGLRATLFHLGVIRYLHQHNKLKEVTRICSVSGGSITAAHLCHRWEQYSGDDENFNSAAAELVLFAMSGIRERVVTRWMLSILLVFPFIKRLLARRRSSNRASSGMLTWLLQSEYDRLFQKARIYDLSGPTLHMLCTSLTTGRPCSFVSSGSQGTDNTGFHFEHRTSPSKFQKTSITATQIPISLAVAASSAFPPLFPPLRIDHDLLGVSSEMFDSPQLISDGGIHDNTGLEWMLSILGDHELSAVIVSDAGAVFDRSAKNYTLPFQRNIRAADILMKQASDLLESQASKDDRYSKRIVKVRIGEEVVPRPGESALPPEVQRMLGRRVTDLDAFSEKEAIMLFKRGLEVAKSHHKEISDLDPRNMLFSDPRPEIKTTLQGDFENHHFRPTIKRKWWSFDPKDSAAWTLAATLVVYLGVFILVLLWLFKHLSFH